MGKILFTWELGGGIGHVSPYIKLIRSLEDQGHQIFFALKTVKNAFRLFKDSKVTFFQSPSIVAAREDLIRPVDSYTKILNNSGYNDVGQLAGMIRAWQNLYTVIDPDLIVFDYSPTAMLAARGGEARRMVIGTGFHIPPAVRPVPGLSSAQGVQQDQGSLLAFEEKILDVINQALQLNNIEPLANFVDLLNADTKIFRTFREMDHYQKRTGASYSGVFKSASGFEPEWPQGLGKKVFAYLKPFKTLPALLKTLNQRQLPTLIYGDGIAEKIKQDYSSKTLHFVDHPLDMDAIGKTADIAICNGNHGTTTEMLLAGVPLLLLPLHAEQNIVAMNVTRLGAGLSAPRLLPEGMEMKLDALIKDDRYQKAARDFASRYSDFNGSSLTSSMLNEIEGLLEK